MRTFLATLSGLIIGGIVIWVLEILGHILFPLPFKVDPTNLEQLRNLMFQVPLGALIALAVAHIVGVAVGMTFAKFIDKGNTMPLYIIGGLFLLSTGINLMAIPHPVWFSILDIAGVLIVSLLFIRSVKKS